MGGSKSVRITSPIHSRFVFLNLYDWVPIGVGVLPKFTLNDEPLFTMKWFVTKKKLGEASRESPTFRVKPRKENFTSQNLSVNFGGLDGVGFMKTVVNFFETQRLMLGHANTDVLKGWRLLSNPDGTDSKNFS